MGGSVYGTCRENKRDCFAYVGKAQCKACSVTTFKGKCPFYKTSDERRKQHEDAVDRLFEIGRKDLIDKYATNNRDGKVWMEI